MLQDPAMLDSSQQLQPCRGLSSTDEGTPAKNTKSKSSRRTSVDKDSQSSMALTATTAHSQDANSNSKNAEPEDESWSSIDLPPVPSVVKRKSITGNSSKRRRSSKAAAHDKLDGSGASTKCSTRRSSFCSHAASTKERNSSSRALLIQEIEDSYQAACDCVSPESQIQRRSSCSDVVLGGTSSSPALKEW